MDNRVRSGIHFEGSAMRYAEIQHVRNERKLLRLGSCDFEFDAEAALFEGHSDRVETIRDALKDVFAGTRSRHFSIVVPPSEAVAFYSAISGELADHDRLNHIESEARLVSGADVSVAVTAEAVATEELDDEKVEWHHVAVMPQSAWERVSSVLSVFDGVRYRYVTRLRSAASLASYHSSAQVGGAAAAVALVGRFGDITETGIVVDGKLRRSQVAELSLPSDVCYQVLSQLSGSGVAQGAVSEVLVYGDRDRDLDNRLASVISADVVRVNPLSTVSNAPASISFDPGRYVLSMGAAS